jgi:hypothetical protein
VVAVSEESRPYAKAQSTQKKNLRSNHATQLAESFDMIGIGFPEFSLRALRLGVRPISASPLNKMSAAGIVAAK